MQQSPDTQETGPEEIKPDNGKGANKADGHLQHHIAALKAWKAGNTDKNGKTAPQGNGAAQAGQQPIMILSAPAGLAATTDNSLTLAAGSNIDQVAQRDLNQTSGRRWLHNVGQHISLFVAGVKDKVSLKLIAARGKVQLQAQSDAMELTADKDVTVTSCKDSITIAAKEEILLNVGGGAYIRMAGGNIEVHCPGTVSVKGAEHALSGPAKMTVTHPDFPQSIPKVPLALHLDQAPKGSSHSWTGMPYTLLADGGEVAKGIIDESGKLHVDHAITTQKYTVKLANGVTFDVPVANEMRNPGKGQLANIGFHKVDAGGAPADGRVEANEHARTRYNSLFNKSDTGTQS